MAKKLLNTGDPTKKKPVKPTVKPAVTVTATRKNTAGSVTLNREKQVRANSTARSVKDVERAVNTPMSRGTKEGKILMEGVNRAKKMGADSLFVPKSGVTGARVLNNKDNFNVTKNRKLAKAFKG